MKLSIALLLVLFSAPTLSADPIKAISFELKQFSDFSKEQYKSLPDIWWFSGNKKVGEAIEKLEEETEAEVHINNRFKKTLYSLLENFKLKKFLRSQHRWYLANAHNDPHLAVDLVAQHIMTHSIEVFGGPLLTANAIAMGAPVWMSSLMGIGSFIISIPGFDPVCLLGFAAYKHIGPYRAAFRATRVTLMLVPQYLFKRFNGQQRMAWLFAREDRVDFIRRALKLEHGKTLALPIKESSELVFEQKVGEEILFKAKFSKSNQIKGIILDEILIKKDVLEKLSDKKIETIKSRWKKTFGANVSQAISKPLKDLTKEKGFLISPKEAFKQNYYVDWMKESKKSYRIKIKEYAVQARGKNKLWLQTKKVCNQLLSKVSVLNNSFYK